MLATYGRNSVPSLSASNLYYKCMSLLKLISLLISRFVVFCFFFLGFVFIVFFFCFFCFFLYLCQDFIIACHVVSGLRCILLDLIIFIHLACPLPLSPHP
jgi:hypothetical protein